MTKKLEDVQDKRAEAGVITTLIKNPSMISHSEFLQPRHFYDTGNQAIYWAISELSKKGVKEIDMFNLSQMIASTKSTQARLSDSGGDEHIRKLIQDAGYTARTNVEEYKDLAKTVSSLGFRRKLYESVRGYEQQCLDLSKPLNQLNSDIITDLSEIGNAYVGNNEFKLYGEKVDQILETIESRRNADGTYGIPVKWDKLKQYISYVSGDLYLIMARYKKGKSLLLAEEQVEKAQMGLKTVLFDTELDDELVTLRLLSIVSGIPIDDIKAGKIGEHNAQKYQDAIHFLKNAPFHREYSHAWDEYSIQQRFELTKHKLGNIDFFIFDYIKDLNKKNASASELSSYLGNFTDYLKNGIAGRYGIPVLSAVQLNRSDEIANSDIIARYATAGMVWREKTFEEIQADGVECGNHALEVNFNRNGGKTQEGDYLDFYVEQDPPKMNLRVHEARQHEAQMPENFKKD